MAIGIPGTASDYSITTSAPLPPPANTADGDVLIAAVIDRNSGGITPPGTWTTLISAFGGSNGDGIIQYLPVPSAASLPSTWTWAGTSPRFDVIIFRVTGMNVSSPVFEAGTPVTAGSDGPGALPMVLPGITAGGGAMAMIFSFFTDQAISADFVPGFSLLATSTTPSAGPGRSSLGVFSALITGPTGNITTANDWPGGGVNGQDGVLIGFQAAQTPVQPQYVYQMRRMP